MYSGKICYRYHPHYGVAVQLVRYLRRGSAAVVIVRLPDASQLAIPEWVLKPEVCEDLKVEAKPRISVSALLDVLKLIGAQPSALADTPRVVQNPQEEVGMHNNENPVIRQRKLHFEDDELWTRLPDSVQERCRSLWKELLASVPKKDERRRHERED